MQHKKIGRSEQKNQVKSLRQKQEEENIMVKENKNADVTSEKKSNRQRIGGRAGFVVGCVLIYFLAVGIIYSAVKLPKAISAMSAKSAISKTKVVLYDGPKSLQDATDEDLANVKENERDITLKHCVDTVVKVNGEESYVYDTNVNNTHTWRTDYYPTMERTPITYFDFDGTVEISVQVKNIDIKAVTIRPLSYGIKPDIDVKNHTVTFRINKPDTYTVEFNKNVKRAVHIFANEIEENVPSRDDKNVLYIGPGEWNIENIVLQDGKTLYIAGGAVVHGIVNANFASNVKVRGRGIIDGSQIRGWRGRTARIPLKFDNCTNFSVEGVTVLNANAWGFQAFNTIGGKIDNLKMITSRPNGDGISLQSCKSIKMENSFIRTWDDSLVVKNYDANSTTLRFKNIQIWTDLAQSMEIGYETNKGKKENSIIDDVSFENITVLHNFHKPVLSIHNADDTAVSNISYKNIVVEDASMGQGDGTPQLIDLKVLQNSTWSSTMERGTIKNVTIDGFKVLYGNKVILSAIEGYDEEHNIDGVTIKGLNIKGKDIKSFEEGGFTIDTLSTANLEIE